MSCTVQRSGEHVARVLTSEGKESETYWDLARAAEEMPDDNYSNVRASLKPFIGKYIHDTTDPGEVALGLYMQLHTEGFKKFFGDWEKDATGMGDRVNDKGEPKIVEHDGTPSFEGKNPGDYRSVFNNGTVAQSYREAYRSVATRNFKDQTDSSKKVTDFLDYKKEQAIKNRLLAANDESLTTGQKVERDNYYRSIIKKIDEEKKQVRSNDATTGVFIQAKNDIQMAKHMLNGISLSISDARFGADVSRFWSNLHETLGLADVSDITDDATREIAESIQDDAQRLLRRFTNLGNANLKKQSAEKFGEDHAITDKDLKATKDVDVFSGFFRDASTTKSPVANMMATQIHESNMANTRTRNVNNDLILAAHEKVKNHPEIVKRGHDIFFVKEKNTDGAMSMGLRQAFSKEYSNLIAKKDVELKRKLSNAGTDKNAVKRAYTEHSEWVKKHAVAFDSSPFIDVDAKGDYLQPESARLAVIDKMVKEGFSREEIDHMVKDSVKRYDAYNSDRDYYREDLYADILHGNTEVPEGTDEDAFVDQKVKEWETLHDPISYHKFLNNEQPFNTAFKGGEYSLSYPRKVVDGKDTGYYDEEFKKISSDPKLHEFYHFFKDFIGKQLDKLPEELTQELGSSFLPVVSDQVTRDLGLNGVKGALNGIDSWMMDALTLVDHSGNKRINPVTGKEMQSIRPRFLDENVPVEGRSTDMVTMMKVFSDMASLYEHKIQIQDQVEMLNDVMQNMTHTLKTDKYGIETGVPQSPDNIKKMMQNTLLRSFYGAGKEAEGIYRGRKFYNSAELLTMGLYKSEKYKIGVGLEKQIKDLDNRLATEDLAADERTQLEKELKELKQSYAGLGGREFAISKAGDALIQSSRLSVMGLNPFSAFRNSIFGHISNRIHALGGLDYSMKDVNKAGFMMKDSVKKYLTWSDKGSEFAEKLLRVALDAGIVEGKDKMFAAGNVNKHSTIEQIKAVIPSPFGLLSSGDYLFKGEMGLALMLGNKVKTANGEHILLDVINKDLTFNEAKFGKFDAAANGAKDFDEYYKNFLNKYVQTGKALHGFSGNTLNIQAKNTIVGRMLSLYKSFLAESIANRFEANRYDPLLRRNTEGFYRTFGRELLKSPVDAFKGVFQALRENKVEGMDKMQVANMRKIFMEMSVMAGLALSYMGLKAIGPNKNDDEDARRKYNLLVNQLFMINRNLTYFINPSSFKDLTQNVFPVLQTVDNYTNAMKAVAYYSFGVEDSNGNQMYDGDKTIKRVTKALPLLNNYNRVINYSKEKMLTGN
jgi:hypothetical protein